MLISKAWTKMRSFLFKPNFFKTLLIRNTTAPKPKTQLLRIWCISCKVINLLTERDRNLFRLKQIQQQTLTRIPSLTEASDLRDIKLRALLENNLTIKKITRTINKMMRGLQITRPWTISQSLNLTETRARLAKKAHLFIRVASGDPTINQLARGKLSILRMITNTVRLSLVKCRIKYLNKIMNRMSTSPNKTTDW